VPGGIGVGQRKWAGAALGQAFAVGPAGVAFVGLEVVGAEELQAGAATAISMEAPSVRTRRNTAAQRSGCLDTACRRA
jgi:hypothetical protein